MSENTDVVTVVVADDQSAVREGLVLLLGTLPGIAVIGEAEDGEAAVEAVAAKNPRVVLMDLNMPRCDGVEATRRIRASHPQTQVVVLTTYSDDDSIIGALQAGARTAADSSRCWTSGSSTAWPAAAASTARPISARVASLVR